VNVKVRRRDLIKLLPGALLAGFPVRSRAAEPSLRPGLCGHNALQSFDPYCFRDSQGRDHQIYVAERHGPPVLLLHELPGLVDADLDTARRIAGRGYTVVAPLLFGEPGGTNNTLGDLGKVVTLCGKHGFACRQGKLTSPHAIWLRELCGSVRQQWAAGKGIGVIGMCLTGAFPLALMSEPSVVAAILCQPTIPFGLLTDKRDLGLSPTDLDRARNRTTVPVLGLRYTGDGKCPKQRFERLVSEFRGRFYRLDLRGKHHSTIAIDCCPDALDEVTAFLAKFVAIGSDATFPRHARLDSREEVVLDTCGDGVHCAAPPRA